MGDFIVKLVKEVPGSCALILIIYLLQTAVEILTLYLPENTVVGPFRRNGRFSRHLSLLRDFELDQQAFKLCSIQNSLRIFTQVIIAVLNLTKELNISEETDDQLLLRN